MAPLDQGKCFVGEKKPNKNSPKFVEVQLFQQGLRDRKASKFQGDPVSTLKEKLRLN